MTTDTTNTAADLAQLDIQGRVATLTLNRTDKRNALSIDLLDALQSKVDQLAATSDRPDRPTALIITGAGKAFSAGMDLKAVLRQPGAPLKLLSAIAELTIAIRNLPMVVIAKVNGAAIGGGCGLVATADIAVTHPDAKLGYPEVDLGVCPAVVAPWLVNALGAGKARRILLEGGTMSGTRALELGLVHECVPKEELDDRTQDIASRIAKAGPDALATTKSLLNEIEGQRLLELVRKGAHLSANVIEGEEAQQRLSAIYGS